VSSFLDEYFLKLLTQAGEKFILGTLSHFLQKPMPGIIRALPDFPLSKPVVNRGALVSTVSSTTGLTQSAITQILPKAEMQKRVVRLDEFFSEEESSETSESDGEEEEDETASGEEWDEEEEDENSRIA
jgi:hypothetical protein